LVIEFGWKQLQQFKATSKKIYVIVDFSASKIFTHHWKSVEDFSSFIESYNYRCINIVPKYSSKELFTNVQNLERIAISTEFGPKLTESPLIHLLNRAVKIFVKKLGANDKKSTIFFKKKIKNIYTRNVKKRIINLASSFEQIEVIVPSAEPLSVSLIENILIEDMRNVNVYLRVIGSQERGVLSLGDETKRLSQLEKNYKNRIRYGFETFPYADFLVEQGVSRHNAFWSPFPPNFSPELKKVKTTARQFVLGFLGTAKERKGFELIPEILNHLESTRESYKLIVQRAVYPWPTYSDALKVLESSNFVELLPAVLSDKELVTSISQCHAIVLPYDPISYGMTASAILYHAADLGIPVIATKGTGFSFEIEKFSIGAVFEDLNIFKNIFEDIRTLSKNSHRSIDLYNSKREESNCIFLRLKEDF
jgi:glycosyltransferase involved in cell wall biosynthesis